MFKQIVSLLLAASVVLALVGAGVFHLYSHENQNENSGQVDAVVDDIKIETPKGATQDGTQKSPVIFSQEGERGYWVTNHTSGTKWYVEVYAPEKSGTYPAIIYVPGGSGSSGSFLQGNDDVRSLVDRGFVAVVFDAEGRGKTGGEENNNGAIDQDGLYDITRFVEELPNVDADRIGMISTSYGITMAAGMLARYPESSVKILGDWEGPADRNDTGGCDANKTGHLQDYGCVDEMFWFEREAVNFIAEVGVPYLRYQTVKDHAQPDYAHTVLMVNTAIKENISVQLNGVAITKPITATSFRLESEMFDRSKIVTMTTDILRVLLK